MLNVHLESEFPDIEVFDLLARLGAGGFGEVYVSRRRRPPEQLAAVKILKYSLDDDSDSPARFLTEIDSIRKAKSAFIPEYLEWGLTDRPFQSVPRRFPWVATQLIAGLPLDEIVKQCGPLPEETVWHIGAGMATAIADIHAAKLAHRDLKPDNVLVAINGPWVIDLGLAYLAGARHRRTSDLPLGPWHYAAPEWWEGGGVGATGTEADIYGLGAVLLLAATGHPPYPPSVTPGQVGSSPPDLRDLPSGPLGNLIQRCLRREKASRPLAEAVREDFRSGAGGADRAAFADVLPEPAMNMLVEHLNDLAAVTGTWGPSELGWGPPRAEPVLKRKQRSGGPSPAPNKDWGDAWTAQVEGWIRGPLVVHGDLIVAASLDGSIATLRVAPNGTLSAARYAPVRIGAALQAGPLVVPDGRRPGTAYVGDAAGIVHGIDLASGEIDTVLEAGAAIEDTPVLVRGSIPGPGDSAVIVKRLCVLAVDGCLHSVDLETGGRKVLYRMRNPATGTLTMSSGLIFAAGLDGSVQAIDALTGTGVWQLPTHGQVLAPPLELGSWLYVCGTDGDVRKVDVEDGQTAATTQVGGPVHCAPVGDAYRIYVASCDGMVRAYDVGHPNPERMDLAWEAAVDDEVAGLAVTSTAVYVSAGRRLIELDRINGDVTRKPFEMSSLISAAPVISGPNCYVARLDGVVMCLSLTRYPRYHIPDIGDGGEVIWLPHFEGGRIDSYLTGTSVNYYPPPRLRQAEKSGHM